MKSAPSRSDVGFVMAVLASGVAAMLMVARPRTDTAALPEDIVATVNGAPITRATYERTRQSLREDRRLEERPGDARHVLDRLIEEELLVQHALAEGLHRTDPRSRADLTAAALTILSTAAEADAPDEETLQAFYEERRARFVAPAEVTLERRYLSGEVGQGIDDAAALAELEASTEPPIPLPSGSLGRRQLTRAFGPTVANELLRSETPLETWLGPFAHDGGRSVVRILARHEPAAPPFHEVREQVEALYRREAGERAVRAFLDAQRAASEVVVSERWSEDGT